MTGDNQKWLDQNTFHHGEFWDILELVKEKESKGLKISLCIPTLNEEKTIGKEVLILKSELMERYPLDEIFLEIFLIFKLFWIACCSRLNTSN